MPELLMVAAVGVACRQVACPSVRMRLLMAVFDGSDVDHSPTESGVIGQVPVTADESENCT